MAVEEIKPRLILIEDEVRHFIRRPGCPDCAEKRQKVYLEETEGQILVGPQEMPMVVWTCPECGFSVNLPPEAFPQSGYQIVNLEGPPQPKLDPDQN